jgi:hypothetical protein
VAYASAEPPPDEEAFQALIKAYVACRLAQEALPRLPDDVRALVEEPLAAFCRAVEPEIDRIESEPGTQRL